MPPFTWYRRRWYPRTRTSWWRRRRFRRRRPRQTIRRRFQRRRWVRRRLYYKKRNRKAKKITVKQWQPDCIRKCTIKGQLCLLTCGQNRINNNFTLTAESYVPVGEPGGGGWSIMQITLRALYDEYLHYRNWWTISNCGLPLVRYSGCQIKFYNSNDCDYIVTVQHTGPFEVTKEDYLNTQPSRHIMNKKSFVVPKLNPNKKKRPYIKKRFPPPALFKSQWYFQQDIVNTPLILFTTSACSFDQMYGPNDQISTNITFYSLNTDMFQNPYWETEENAPYFPKVTGTQNTGLYTEGNGNIDTSNIFWKNLLPLYNTKQWKKITHQQEYYKSWDEWNKQSNWGNPFTYSNHEETQDIPIFYAIAPTESNFKADTKPTSILPITGIYQQCRYNPFKDKGIGNKVYIKCTKKNEGSFTSLPTDPRLLITDFPLWLVFWGWISWLEKSKPVHHILEDYQLVFQTPYVYPPMKSYVPLDMYFTHTDGKNLTETDKQHWHPKLAFQTEILSKFAETGPAAPKINKQKQLQVHCFYKFFFKWGGCPAPMETVCDPAEQEKFPTPYNLLQELTIEDPETPKEHHIYKFDERQQMLTAPAAKRLKTQYDSTKYFTEFGAKDPQLEIFPPTDQTQKTPTKKEEKDPQLLQQLNELQQQREYLEQRIHRLMKRKKLFPM